jgi:N-acetylglucosaminyl-diphospho-decaprenol L-rhamnosyltransferase
MSGRLWVIIVNYRTPALAVDCLSSLASEIAILPGSKVIVVDNDSGDGSVASISSAVAEQGWGKWVEIVPMARNGGFAYGNNAGLRAALSAPNSPDYVLLLNPDTLVMPKSLATFLAFMDSHPRCGIAGCLIEDGEGGIGCSSHNFPSPISEFEQGLRCGPVARWLEKYVVSPPQPSVTHRCGWVSGACMMLRREVLEQVGLMDDGYFLYFEEVDYCRLTTMHGWEVWFTPEVRVVHLEGASTGIDDRRKRRASYWYESRRRFFTRHYGVAGLLLADLLWVTGRLGYVVLRVLTLGAKSQSCEPVGYARDLLLGDLRAFIKGCLRSIPRVRRRALPMEER